MMSVTVLLRNPLLNRRAQTVMSGIDRTQWEDVVRLERAIADGAEKVGKQIGWRSSLRGLVLPMALTPLSPQPQPDVRPPAQILAGTAPATS